MDSHTQDHRHDDVLVSATDNLSSQLVDRDLILFDLNLGQFFFCFSLRDVFRNPDGLHQLYRVCPVNSTELSTSWEATSH